MLEKWLIKWTALRGDWTSRNFSKLRRNEENWIKRDLFKQSRWYLRFRKPLAWQMTEEMGFFKNVPGKSSSTLRLVRFSRQKMRISNKTFSSFASIYFCSIFSRISQPVSQITGTYLLPGGWYDFSFSEEILNRREERHAINRILETR